MAKTAEQREIEVVKANIRRLRQNLGLSHKQAGELAGITESAWFRHEGWISRPFRDQGELKRMAKALGTTVRKLKIPQVVDNAVPASPTQTREIQGLLDVLVWSGPIEACR